MLMYLDSRLKSGAFIKNKIYIYIVKYNDIFDIKILA